MIYFEADKLFLSVAGGSVGRVVSKRGMLGPLYFASWPRGSVMTYSRELPEPTRNNQKRAIVIFVRLRRK